MRLFAIAEAMRRGMSLSRIHELTRITPWFLKRIRTIVNTSEEISRYPLEELPEALFRRAKEVGFSDNQISRLVIRENPPAPGYADMLTVRRRRVIEGPLHPSSGRMGGRHGEIDGDPEKQGKHN